MNYWQEFVAEVLGENDMPASEAQIIAIAEAFEGARQTEIEYSGISASTKPGAPQKSAEALRIERLEEAIRRLSARYGVGIDVNRMELSYYTPVGTSHVGTTTEAL